jgi:primosomal protein N'
MTANPRHFVVCVRNDEHEASLELRKIYEVIEDESAVRHDMIRVIDEEGEAYLYPRSWFLPIELPGRVEEVIVELTHR